MKKEIKYIELKSGFSHNGPAWIAEIELSKSGNTIYFNDRALKKLKSPGVSANHFDIETGEEYWVSGIKKDGLDRHKFGLGKIMIDNDIYKNYLHFIKSNEVDKKKFEIVDIIKDFDKSRFNALENSNVDFQNLQQQSYSTWFWDNNRRKLVLQN